MKSFLVLLAFCLGVTIARGQSVPLFTADYYLANPDAYVGKTITLAVAHVHLRNEQRDDGMRELEAHTYNQGAFGGRLPIFTSTSAAPGLITLCGTALKSSGSGFHFTLIRGTFLREETGKRRFYLLFKG